MIKNIFSLFKFSNRMAKKRSKTKGRRRRRIGAARLNAGSNLVKLGFVGAGYFLGDKINPLIDKVTAGKVSDKIVGAGQTGLGGLLLLKGRSSMIKTAAGGLLAGSGLKRALRAFGVLAPALPSAAVSGYGMVPVIGGYGQVPVIGAYTPNVSLGSYRVPGRVGRTMGATEGSGLIGNN